MPEDAGFCPRCGRSQNDRDSAPIFVVDAATELFNHVFLDAIIGQEVNRAVRYHRPLSAMVVEVDHGDALLEDMGLEGVRELLKELGQVLVDAVRDTDTVGFLDCEPIPRFGVVLPETDFAGASLAADKLRSTVALHEFESGGHWQRLTVSCGMATVIFEGGADQELIAEAQAAIAAGREAGAGPNRTFHTVLA